MRVTFNKKQLKLSLKFDNAEQIATMGDIMVTIIEAIAHETPQYTER